MTDQLAISIAQLNPTVGDIAGNIAKLRRARQEAAGQGADLVVGTELCVAGYPPEDLVLKPAFVAACQAAVRDFARETTSGPAIIVGTPWRQDGKLYNAAALLDRGQVAALRFKHELPNYGVFDEKRVFAAGPAPGPIAFRGVRLGLMICEDMWTPDPTEALQESGAALLLVINGSPFESNKRDERLSFAAARVKESAFPLLYVNQMTRQDEGGFDGASLAVDAECHLRVQLPDWREAVVPTRWRRGAAERWTVEPVLLSRPSEGPEAIYQAMVLGLRDYVRKNRFPGVVLGLSGGIDSALSAPLPLPALGADQAHSLMIPSPYPPHDTLADPAPFP